MESPAQSPNHLTTQPPNNPTAQPPALIIGGVGMIVLAAFLFLCGLCSALFYLVLPLTPRGVTSDLSSNIVFGSLAGLGFVLGALLAWQGVNLVRGRASRVAAKAFPPARIFGGVFGLVLIVGAIVLAIKPIAAYVFPPWHFLAATLPPLAFLAYAARRLGSDSGFRALLTAFSWGALGATPLAMLFEILAGIVLVLLAAIVLVLSPGSQALLQQLQSEVPLTRGTLDPTTALQLLTNPTVALAFLAYFSILVPIIEEMLKSLVVAFIDPRRTRLADAVLWGISAGAGFAAVENLFNTSGDLTIWVLAMVLRVGATTMHVANGVTMARGWYAARVERRWSRLLIAFGVSVFFHALWNAVAIGLSGVALVLINTPQPTLETGLPVGLLMGAAGVILIVLAASGVTWIAYSVRAVRQPTA